MSKSIQQFLKCIFISSPLVRWKWPNASENFGNTLVGLRPCNGAIHDFRRSNVFGPKKKRYFSGIWKNAVFSGSTPGWRSEKILVIWLAGYLAGWLAIYLAGWLISLAALAGWLFGNWLCGCLAGYLAISYLAMAGWLADWQIGIGYLAGSLNGSLSGLLSGYLDGWLAIWLAGYLAGWFGGGLRAGWLIVWWFAR